MSDNNSNLVGILSAFAAGAVIGAAVALLTAPNSGKETRDAIADGARKLKDKVCDSYDDAKEMIAEKKELIAAAYEAGKQAIKEQKTKDSAQA